MPTLTAHKEDTMKRYYIMPGPSGSNSWSVFDSTRKNEWGDTWCEVPCVTHHQALMCCHSLNSGQGAWDWEAK